MKEDIDAESHEQLKAPTVVNEKEINIEKPAAEKEALEPMPIKASSPSGKDSSGGNGVASATSEFRSLTSPKVIFLALVFAGSQLIQELVTEAIFTKYETDRLTYELVMLYSCSQQLGTVIVALLVMLWSREERKDDDKAPSVVPSWRITIILALLVFASTALPNWAVEFVYFPAKVVAKSTKLVPTMVVSVIMGNSKKFTAVDYIAALLLCSGAASFALNSGRVDVDEEGVESAKENVWIGLVLLSVSSLADALVPNLQQVTMRAGASAEQVALRVNLVGAGWVFIVLLISGALKVWFLEIFWAQPQLLLLILAGSATLGMAVLAYTMLIREAGSVVAVAIATARKVLTLTLSYIVFPGDGKTFGTPHAISAFAVAFGMALGPLYERFKTWRKSGSEYPEYSRV